MCVWAKCEHLEFTCKQNTDIQTYTVTHDTYSENQSFFFKFQFFSSNKKENLIANTTLSIQNNRFDYKLQKQNQTYTHSGRERDIRRE